MSEVNEAALLHNYLLVGGLLFAIGAVGFLVRRNLIVLFLCAEMMLQGVTVSLVAWGALLRRLGRPDAGALHDCRGGLRSGDRDDADRGPVPPQRPAGHGDVAGLAGRGRAALRGP